MLTYIFVLVEIFDGFDIFQWNCQINTIEGDKLIREYKTMKETVFNDGIFYWLKK